MKKRTEIAWLRLALAGLALNILVVSGWAAALPPSLFFVANEGQWEGAFAFKCEVGNASYFVTPSGMTIELRQYDKPARSHEPMDRMRDPERARREWEETRVRGHVLRMSFVNANPNPEIIGEEKLASYSNYFLGRDSCNWRSRVGHYAKVLAKNVWAGIDAEYQVQDDGVETIYHVKPGADLSQIVIQYEGQDAPLTIGANSSLHLQTSLGVVEEKAPFAYQIVNGRQIEVPTRYELMGDKKYTLRCEGVDASRELVIDPTLAYSSYFAGVYGDGINTMVFDQDGDLVLIGSTARTTFPTTPGAYQETAPPGINGYITKLDPYGLTIRYSTYFSGTRNGGGTGIVDRMDRIYYLAITDSARWPLTPDAFDTVASWAEVGIARLSADGAILEFGSYLGGTGTDYPELCSLDTLGNLYILGVTNSGDFPVTDDAIFRTAAPGYWDGFITVFDPLNSSIGYSTLLTDSPAEIQAVFQLVVSHPGDVWVAMIAESGMPVSTRALQSTPHGIGSDYFAHLDFNRRALLYGSYLGSQIDNHLEQIVPEDSTIVWLVGDAEALDFAFPVGGLHQTPVGGTDFFVVKLSLPDSIELATFVGGVDDEYWPIAFRESTGTWIVAGASASDDFPTSSDAFSQTYSGGEAEDAGDIVVCRLSPDLSSLTYGTYLGGSYRDEPSMLAYASPAEIWISSYTESTNFPLTSDAIFRHSDNWAISRFNLSTDAAHEPATALPKEISVSCFPNPFNPTTTLSFALPSSERVTLDVYDVLGRLAFSTDIGRMSSGEHSYRLDGSGMASGVYFAALRAGKETVVKKVALLK